MHAGLRHAILLGLKAERACLRPLLGALSFLVSAALPVQASLQQTDSLAYSRWSHTRAALLVKQKGCCHHRQLWLGIIHRCIAASLHWADCEGQVLVCVAGPAPHAVAEADDEDDEPAEFAFRRRADSADESDNEEVRLAFLK